MPLQNQDLPLLHPGHDARCGKRTDAGPDDDQVVILLVIHEGSQPTFPRWPLDRAILACAWRIPNQAAIVV